MASALREYSSCASLSSLVPAVCAFGDEAVAKYIVLAIALTPAGSAHGERLTALLCALAWAGRLSRRAVSSAIALAVGRLQADLSLDAPGGAQALGALAAWAAVDAVLDLDELAASVGLVRRDGGWAAGRAGLGVPEPLSGLAVLACAAAAPSPLLQLRARFGSSVRAFLRAADVETLAASVAAVHARHAAPQLARKLLQAALGAAPAQARWLADALVALARSGMLEPEAVAAGAGALLHELPALAAAADVPPAAAAAAATRALAHACAAGVLDPARLAALAAGAGAGGAAVAAAAAAADAVGLWDAAAAPALADLRAAASQSLAAAAAGGDDALDAAGAALAPVLAGPGAHVVALLALEAAADDAGARASARTLVFLAHARWLKAEPLAAGVRGFFVRRPAPDSRGPLLVVEALVRSAVLPMTVLAELERDAADGDDGDEALEAALAGLRGRLR